MAIRLSMSVVCPGFTLWRLFSPLVEQYKPRALERLSSPPTVFWEAAGPNVDDFQREVVSLN